MRLFLLPLLATIATHATIITAATAAEDAILLKFANLASWFRTNGGTLDSRVKIGFHDPRPNHRVDKMGHPIEGANRDDSPPSTVDPKEKIRGLVAVGDIAANSLLMSIPPSLILSGDSGSGVCGTIASMIKEMKLGIQSKWHTYLDFIDSPESANSSGGHIDSIRVPTLWDRNAAAILELQGLPPVGETHRHVDWYVGDCLRDRKREKYIGESGEEEEEVKFDEVESRALLMHLTRSVDLGFVPIFDLMNHHNGLINTYIQTGPDGSLNVYALTDIPAHQPIYNTYSRSGALSTVDLFNTHGFVEDYPQLWRWNDETWAQMHMQDEDHARKRYASNTGDGGEGHEPNTHHYEILIISPELAALSPTKQLVDILGNGQRTIAEWETLITRHHANIHSYHVRQVRDSAKSILEMLPTTIAQDSRLIPEEKWKLERVKKVGRMDVNKADRIQAMEFRLEFKKALRLALEVAEGGEFFGSSEL